MSGHSIVIVVDLHLPAIGPHPQTATDQTMRRRIERSPYHHVTVRVQLGLLPHSQIVGRGRQRQKRRLLHFQEPRQRPLLGGPVDPNPRYLLHPPQYLLVGIHHIPQPTSRQKIPLQILHPRLHLPLVTRLSRPAG